MSYFFAAQTKQRVSHPRELSNANEKRFPKKLKERKYAGSKRQDENYTDEDEDDEQDYSDVTPSLLTT